MAFIPHTEQDIATMLQEIGITSVKELFADLPAGLLYPELKLDKPLSELEVMRELEALSIKNTTPQGRAWFLGAGVYNHFIPALVNAITSRGEFTTAYTPYQPEVSQGGLQAIFEYQSMVAQLLGMDIVNASHYDGSTALAEAVLIAYNVAGTKDLQGARQISDDNVKDTILICSDMHPEYKEVIKTYIQAYPIRYKEYAMDNAGKIVLDDSELQRAFGVVAPYPGFSGRIYSLDKIATLAHAARALCILHVDPILCALLKSPGDLGADIVTAEGQVLGNPMNFGGPGLGIMGSRTALLRKMPGRIAGMAYDKSGRRGFVLTLTAREQHIRREKAVSNICSNQGLIMLRACMYLAAMGKSGMKHVARLCWDKAHYAAHKLGSCPGYKIMDGEFFKEFIVCTPIPAQEIYDRLCSRSVVPGLPLSRYYPEHTHELLVAVTETNTRGQIDLLANSLTEVLR